MVKDKALYEQMFPVGLNPDGYVRAKGIELDLKWYKSGAAREISNSRMFSITSTWIGPPSARKIRVNNQGGLGLQPSLLPLLTVWRWCQVRMEGKVISFSPLLLLVLWEVLARAGVVDIRLFSCPSRIMETFVPVFSGELLYHSWISVRRILLGFAAGAIPGVLLGLSMGLFPLVRAALEPMVAATFPIPKLYIMPLILLVFGLGKVLKCLPLPSVFLLSAD